MLFLRQMIQLKFVSLYGIANGMHLHPTVKTIGETNLYFTS